MMHLNVLTMRMKFGRFVELQRLLIELQNLKKWNHLLSLAMKLI